MGTRSFHSFFATLLEQRDSLDVRTSIALLVVPIVDVDQTGVKDRRQICRASTRLQTKLYERPYSEIRLKITVSDELNLCTPQLSDVCYVVHHLDV